MLRKNKGFTLIELMIVVAIIGIMAAIAIPNFISYLCKSKQSAANTNLGAIATSEEAYAAETNTYSSSFSTIGFVTKGTPRYTYNISVANTTAFTALAHSSAINGVNNDQWSMNQERQLTKVTDGCL